MKKVIFSIAVSVMLLSTFQVDAQSTSKKTTYISGDTIKLDQGSIVIKTIPKSVSTGFDKVSFEVIGGFMSNNTIYWNDNDNRVKKTYKPKKKTYTKRVGAICKDGTRSYSTGRGTCSHHGGVRTWIYK